MRRFLFFFVLTVLLVCVLVGLFVCQFLFTDKGLDFTARRVISALLAPQKITIQEARGSLTQGLALSGIELKGVDVFSFKTNISIQEVLVSLPPKEKFSITVVNGKFKLPGSEQILFFGNITPIRLELTVYCKRLKLPEFIAGIPDTDYLESLEGHIDEIDLYIKGSPRQPRVSGSMRAHDINYYALFVKKSTVLADIGFSDIRYAPLKMLGDIIIKEAAMIANTAYIAIPESRIEFKTDATNPTLSLTGFSQVQDTNITITCWGPLKNPTLELSSEPPLSREKIIMMLATGQAWKTEGVPLLDKNKEDLVKEIVDYFVLGKGEGNLSEALGISEISLKSNESSKEILLKKALSRQADVHFGIEQSQEDISATATQKMGVEYRLSERFSLETQTDISPRDTILQETDPQTTDTFILRFKKEF